MPEHEQAERSPDELEVIDRRGRHVLGATEEHYVIVGAGGTLERFPLTEEGFEAAERRFAQLRRLERREAGIVVRALTVALWAGVGIWLVTGLGAVLLTLFRPRGEVFGRLDEVFFLLDSVGFRAAVGALLLLAGVLLAQRERGTGRDGPASSPTDPSGGQPPWSDITPSHALDQILIVLLAAGLALWILGAVATQLFREPISPGAGVVGPVTQPHPIAIFVEALAFRVWVAAGALLAARRAVSHLR